MPHIEFWKQITNHLPASYEFHQITEKQPPAYDLTEDLPYFNVKFKNSVSLRMA